MKEPKIWADGDCVKIGMLLYIKLDHKYMKLRIPKSISEKLASVN